MAMFFKSEDGAFLAALQADTKAPAGYEALEANAVDAATEKHVPAVEIQHDGRLIQVTVGSTEHPMDADHYIQWVALEAGDRLEVHHLKPGQSPVTFFPGGEKAGTVYAYCNLHGLWKATF